MFDNLKLFCARTREAPDGKTPWQQYFKLGKHSLDGEPE